MKNEYIIIGADFAPIENDGVRIVQGKQEEVLDADIAKIISDADFSVFNMEAPIEYEDMIPLKKDGPRLYIPGGAEKIYQHIGVDLLLLANNHIMDWGEKGLFHTMKKLDDMGIAYVGAGKNNKFANQAFCKELNGKKIAFYAVAEKEFSIADEDAAGANGFSQRVSNERIKEIKKECDFLIVFYHGGRELYQYPSPEQQEKCRDMIDYGADMVICQHSHCVGSTEYYKQGEIYYGQGNFVFGEPDAKICEYSMLLKISVEDKLVTEMIPIRRSEGKVRLLTVDEKNIFAETISTLNENITKDNFIKENYQELSLQAIAPYLYQFAGWPLWAIRMDKLFQRKLIKHVFRRNERRLLFLQNVLQCDAHREIVLEGLKQLRRQSDK